MIWKEVVGRIAIVILIIMFGHFDTLARNFFQKKHKVQQLNHHNIYPLLLTMFFCSFMIILTAIDLLRLKLGFF